MWISAILGMMTIFAENVLGMKYRVRDETGEWHGGAMYYIERGLHSKLLAKVFAFACVLASLGMGNMAQANSISQAFRESFHVPAWVTGPVLAVVVFCDRVRWDPADRQSCGKSGPRDGVGVPLSLHYGVDRLPGACRGGIIGDYF